MNEALAAIDRLMESVGTLATTLVEAARHETSPGIERAILRLFDVGGLGPDGRPLANAVVDGHTGGDQEILGRGIGLPFAMAIAEYDVPPQRLARDIAMGSVVLRDEAALLDDPGRRAAAEAEAARLVKHALATSDANRMARRELTEVVGEAPWPWIAVPLREATADAAAEEATAAVQAGADVLRVSVPVGREFVDRVAHAGGDAPRWAAPDGASASDVAPAGSQRGLNALRHHLDELSAERRGAVRLMMAASPLAAPEAAVVAALERIDLVSSDAVVDAVDGGIDPDRAIADIVFACRLLDRAGCMLVLGPGPLVVGPDLAAGAPAGVATRAGRALGLGVLSVAIARAAGMRDARIALGGMPAWASEESTAEVALIGVALRRACLPDVPLAFEEPPGVHPRWLALMAAAIADAAPVALVGRDMTAGAISAAIGSTRGAIDVAAASSRAFESRDLGPDGMEIALTMLDAAIDIVTHIADDGWRAVVPSLASGRAPVGSGSTVRRAPGSDPFELA